jgi:hypothetical protein
MIKKCTNLVLHVPIRHGKLKCRYCTTVLLVTHEVGQLVEQVAPL